VEQTVPSAKGCSGSPLECVPSMFDSSKVKVLFTT